MDIKDRKKFGNRYKLHGGRGASIRALADS
jgi:hypothetical protein